MDWDWTASFSIRFRNGTCIIILDKKYNIANSSCHFGSYGSIWTGPSPKKYYMDLQCHELFAIYYLIVKFYMFYKVFCIFNYFWGCGFLVVIYCLATFDLYCDWSKQFHEYSFRTKFKTSKKFKIFKRFQNFHKISKFSKNF